MSRHAASLRASRGPGSQCPINSKRQNVTWCPLPAGLEQAVLDEPLGGLLGVVGEDRDRGRGRGRVRGRVRVRVGVRVGVRVRVRVDAGLASRLEERHTWG